MTAKKDKKGKLVYEEKATGGTFRIYETNKGYRVVGPGFDRPYRTLYGSRMGLQGFRRTGN